MSFAAIRWALAQPVDKATAKFVLVIMADCVNARTVEWFAWPSYQTIANRTGLDYKTVESGVSRLKAAGFLIDSGKRGGPTGKSVVYRLNTPENGVTLTDIEGEGGDQLQHANGPEIGVIKSGSNGPVFPSNPPKFPVESPQISGQVTPKTGSESVRGTRKRTSKESGTTALERPAEVTEQVWADWTKLRAKKRANVDATTVAGAREEAGKAGISLDRFLAIWCMRGSQGLQADWLKPNERGPQAARGQSPINATDRDAEAARLLGFGAQETLDA